MRLPSEQERVLAGHDGGILFDEGQDVFNRRPGHEAVDLRVLRDALHGELDHHGLAVLERRGQLEELELVLLRQRSPGVRDEVGLGDLHARDRVALVFQRVHQRLQHAGAILLDLVRREAAREEEHRPGFVAGAVDLDRDKHLVDAAPLLRVDGVPGHGLKVDPLGPLSARHLSNSIRCHRCGAGRAGAVRDRASGDRGLWEGSRQEKQRVFNHRYLGRHQLDGPVPDLATIGVEEGEERVLVDVVGQEHTVLPSTCAPTGSGVSTRKIPSSLKPPLVAASFRPTNSVSAKSNWSDWLGSMDERLMNWGCWVGMTHAPPNADAQARVDYCLKFNIFRQPKHQIFPNVTE